MPEIFSFAGYSVYFTALDRDHGVHVHIGHGSEHDLARFILQSDHTVALAHNNGRLSARIIKKLQFFLSANYDDIVMAWRMFFGDDYHFDR